MAKKSLYTHSSILNTRPGFTLVETLIAISVVGVVITAAWQLTTSSVKIGHASMKQFVALHAAEEGLEIVRNMRDSNWLRNASWRSGLSDGMYVISENAPWTLQNVASADEAPEINGLKRVIHVETVDSSMRATSRVFWKTGNVEKNMELTAEFTNWKK